MKNNNYALFYRTSKFSTWQSKRPDLPVEEWENYAQEQEYAEYDIKKLDNYDRRSRIRFRINSAKISKKTNYPNSCCSS